MHTIRDRFRGCLLGGAVGDALGAPGRITGDTQTSLFTAGGPAARRGGGLR